MSENERELKGWWRKTGKWLWQFDGVKAFIWWFIVVVGIGGVVFLISYYFFSHEVFSKAIRDSMFWRNISFPLAAVGGLYLALWRGFNADRQAKIANREAETNERKLIIERYSNAIKQLQDDNGDVRLDGINTLYEIAKEVPDQYTKLVVEALTGFIRNPPYKKERVAGSRIIGYDIHKAMEFLDELHSGKG